MRKVKHERKFDQKSGVYKDTLQDHKALLKSWNETINFKLASQGILRD